MYFQRETLSLFLSVLSVYAFLSFRLPEPRSIRIVSLNWVRLSWCLLGYDTLRRSFPRHYKCEWEREKTPFHCNMLRIHALLFYLYFHVKITFLTFTPPSLFYLSSGFFLYTPWIAFKAQIYVHVGIGFVIHKKEAKKL